MSRLHTPLGLEGDAICEVRTSTRFPRAATETAILRTSYFQWTHRPPVRLRLLRLSVPLKHPGTEGGSIHLDTWKAHPLHLPQLLAMRTTKSASLFLDKTKQNKNIPIPLVQFAAPSEIGHCISCLRLLGRGPLERAAPDLSSPETTHSVAYQNGINLEANPPEGWRGQSVS